MKPNDIQTWVSVKQFQKNVYKVFDNMPVVITKRGIPFAIIFAVAGTGKENSRPTPESGYEEPPRPKRTLPFGIRAIEGVVEGIQEEKQIAVCEHGRQKGLCEFGCK